MAGAMDQLTGLMSVLQTIQGTDAKTKTKQSTSGTQTTQTNVSDQGVQQILNQILSGPGGVKSVGGAARQSGLYNSTTEDKLLGDVYATAANQAELARSPTTVSSSGSMSQTQSVEQPGVGVGSVAGIIGAAQVGKALFGGAAAGGEPGLLSGASDAISGFFGGGAGAVAGGATTAATSAVSGATASAAVNAGVAGTAGGALSAGAAGQAAGAAGAATGAAAQGFGANFATAIPLGGSFLGGLLGGKDAATEPTSLAMNAMMGAMALGPVGLIAAPLAAIAGGFLKDMSVICTALMNKGLLTSELHAHGAKYFGTVSITTKYGYWLWGVPVAKKIRDNSRMATLVALPVVTSYMKFLRDRKIHKEPLGAICHYIGEPICWCIGKVSSTMDSYYVKAN
jgi:hypothetical protein